VCCGLNEGQQRGRWQRQVWRLRAHSRSTCNAMRAMAVAVACARRGKCHFAPTRPTLSSRHAHVAYHRGHASSSSRPLGVFRRVIAHLGAVHAFPHAARTTRRALWEAVAGVPLAMAQTAHEVECQTDGKHGTDRHRRAPRLPANVISRGAVAEGADASCDVATELVHHGPKHGRRTRCHRRRCQQVIGHAPSP